MAATVAVASSAQPQDSFQVNINGLGGSICTLIADPDWQVRDLKAAVEAAASIPVCLQRLLAGVTELQDVDQLPPPSPQRGDPAELTLLRRPPEQAEWLAAVQSCWASFLTAPGEMRADYEVALAAVKQHGSLLRYASDPLRRDRQVVLGAVSSEGGALQYASESLRGDREVILKAVATDGRALKHAADWARADAEIARAAVNQSGLALAFVAEWLREDRELILAAVRSNGLALRYASEVYRADHEVVKAAVQQTKRAAVFVSQGMCKPLEQVPAEDAHGLSEAGQIWLQHSEA